eukprot:6472521-Amphidinium_carterae.2
MECILHKELPTSVPTYDRPMEAQACNSDDIVHVTMSGRVLRSIRTRKASNLTSDTTSHGTRKLLALHTRTTIHEMLFAHMSDKSWIGKSTMVSLVQKPVFAYLITCTSIQTQQISSTSCEVVNPPACSNITVLSATRSWHRTWRMHSQELEGFAYAVRMRKGP